MVVAQLFDLVDEVAVQHRRRVKTSVLNEVSDDRAPPRAVRLSRGGKIYGWHSPTMSGCDVEVSDCRARRLRSSRSIRSTGGQLVLEEAIARVDPLRA